MHTTFWLHIEAAGINSPWAQAVIAETKRLFQASGPGCFGYRIDELVHSKTDLDEMLEVTRHVVEVIKVAIALGLKKVDIALSGVHPDFFGGQTPLAHFGTVGEAVIELLSGRAPEEGTTWEYISWMDIPFWRE
ncbi:MAG TPA: hypothetical protein PKG77_16150 [Phycisphaerae bacterium]|nr:hypothetical protein [Phycisphaerae bacterium]HQL75401.1 hypothetical protein [Phycisphaerae bacterium]